MKQKNTWMLLLTIGIVSSSVLLSSCVRRIVDYTYYAYYFYENGSQSKINIEAYGHDDTGNKTIEYLEMKPGDVEDFVFISSSEKDKPNFIIRADSLKIIFDDARHIWYHQSDMNKKYNPLNYENYVRKNTQVSVTHNNFVFTREMYDLAIDND